MKGRKTASERHERGYDTKIIVVVVAVVVVVVFVGASGALVLEQPLATGAHLAVSIRLSVG